MGKWKGPKQETTGIKSEFPSRFGSHASMIDEALTKQLKDKSLVVLKDERGHYITEMFRLDSGLADPNRYTSLDYRKEQFKLHNIDGRVKAVDYAKSEK